MRRDKLIALIDERIGLKFGDRDRYSISSLENDVAALKSWRIQSECSHCFCKDKQYIYGAGFFPGSHCCECGKLRSEPPSICKDKKG